MANAQSNDGSLRLVFLLYARIYSACIPLMVSDTMSKTTSITIKAQTVISLGLIAQYCICLPMDKVVELSDPSSVDSNDPVLVNKNE